MSGKRDSLVLVLALCIVVFACFLYFRSRRAQVSSNFLRPSNQSDVALAATPAEDSYGVDISPRQGFIVVAEYDGQQGAGLESLVSLQVYNRLGLCIL